MLAFENTLNSLNPINLKIFGHFEQFQTNLDKYKLIWTSLDTFGRVWTLQDKFRVILRIFVQNMEAVLP